jgi:hypothetical protein
MREGWLQHPTRTDDTERLFGSVTAEAFPSGPVGKKGFRFEIWHNGKMVHSDHELRLAMDDAQLAAENWLRNYATTEARRWSIVVSLLRTAAPDAPEAGE